MKKKIFGGIAVLAFAAIVGLNVKMNANDNQMADLSMANVEALANGENAPNICYMDNSYGSCSWYNKSYYCPCGSM